MGKHDTETDIIVGWGLAGICLAWQLYFEGKKFIVYDANESQSTRTAAGLVNPIVFKRLNMSWKADVLMPYALSFYSKIEQELGVELLSRQSIFRVFRDVEEENNWSAKQGDERFKSILKSPKDSDLPNPAMIPNKFGIGEVLTFGNLDTNLFIEASKKFLQSQDVQFIETKFDYRQANSIQNKVFFCEGFGVKKNPIFKHLPVNGTHGEVLIIRTKNYNFKGVVNKNMFVLKLSDNLYKVGATYNWDIKEPITTQEARLDLIERLNGFTNFEYEIVEQLSGVRPTVIDRRPILGRSLKKDTHFVFNGLGTKGVMLAPYFSDELLKNAYLGSDVDLEVDVRRYDHLITK
jgi:glycine/D-amino acid oxidase-like deaminating enzyme